MGKPMCTAIVWIRDFFLTGTLGKGQKQAKSPRIVSRAYGCEVLQILVIHCEDVIKALKITRVYLPGTQ